MGKEEDFRGELLEELKLRERKKSFQIGDSLKEQLLQCNGT